MYNSHEVHENDRHVCTPTLSLFSVRPFNFPPICPTHQTIKCPPVVSTWIPVVFRSLIK